MSAGRLNQQVALLRREVATSSTGSGATVESFAHEATVWALVEPLSGTEGFAGDQRFASSSVRFRIRYRADVRVEWRVEWRGEQYDVEAVLPAGQQLREWLDLAASASPAENPA